eukprot:scaffold58086_cov20-Tisochrysis_lutea.AAC.2
MAYLACGTGYMGSVTVLEAIADVMQKMKAANDGHRQKGPSVIYLTASLLLLPPLFDVRISHPPNSWTSWLRLCHFPVSRCSWCPAVCDPVMGDEGKLYVAPELVQAYRNRIMPLASVLVPNQSAGEQFQRLALRIPKIDAYFTGTGECLILFQVACLSTHFSTSIEAVDLSGLVCVSLSINSHFWAECLWRKIALVARNYFPSLQRRGVGGL